MSTAPHTERTPLAEIRLGRSVSIDQAGHLLNVSRRTVYNRIRDGRLRTIRTSGGSQRVLVESLYELGFRPQAFSTSASAATFAIRSIRNPGPPAVIESPPVTHEQRTSISTVRSKAYTGLICIAALFLSVTDVSAQARISADLKDRLQAGDNAATSVIVTGTQAQVDAIATRYGLRVRKRLTSGAVLDVPAGRLAGLAADGSLDALSGNYRLRSHMGVTTVAIGADQVWEDGWAAGAAGVTGKGVGVAVIDSGVADLPELRGRIVVSMDFTKRKGQRAYRAMVTVTGGRFVAPEIGLPMKGHRHGRHPSGTTSETRVSGADARAVWAGQPRSEGSVAG